MDMLKYAIKDSVNIQSKITPENAFDVGVAMVVALYKEGDIESATSWLKYTHQMIQNKKDCCCGNAEWLAGIACVIGRPELADDIGKHTHCNKYHDSRFAPLKASGTMLENEALKKHRMDVLEGKWWLERYARTLHRICGVSDPEVSDAVVKIESHSDLFKQLFEEIEKK